MASSWQNRKRARVRQHESTVRVQPSWPEHLPRLFRWRLLFQHTLKDTNWGKSLLCSTADLLNQIYEKHSCVETGPGHSQTGWNLRLDELPLLLKVWSTHSTPASQRISSPTQIYWTWVFCFCHQPKWVSSSILTPVIQKPCSGTAPAYQIRTALIFCWPLSWPLRPAGGEDGAGSAQKTETPVPLSAQCKWEIYCPSMDDMEAIEQRSIFCLSHLLSA